MKFSKFTIRDLFWLMLVVALSLTAWRIKHDADKRWLAIKPLIDKFDLQGLNNYIDSHGGVTNLHYLKIEFGDYYGSDAEMRFKSNDTILPTIKKFEMHNEGINQSRPKQTQWRKAN